MASLTRCNECRLITSEFILSRDFVRETSKWSVRENYGGGRLQRSLVHHTFASLEVSAQRGCDLCVFLRQQIFRFRSVGRETFPASEEVLRIKVEEGYNGEQRGFQLIWRNWVFGVYVICEALQEDYDSAVTRPSFQTIRRLTSDTKAEDLQNLATSIIKPWLEQCDSGHCTAEQIDHEVDLARNVDRMRLSTLNFPLLPTRVIDVGLKNGNPRLYTSKPEERGRYLILSYCWGSGNTARTTELNVEARASQIDFSALPKTIQDAIEVTQALGERFLWVDTICIIRSIKPGEACTADWNTESSKMCQYYENSYCTIAAAHAQDCSEGFLNRTAERYPVSNDIRLEPWADSTSLATLQRIRTVRVFPTPPNWTDEVARAPLFKRGWTFQERALSPRLLHWSRACLWWECSHSRASEYSPHDEAKVYDHPEIEELYLHMDKLLALPRAEALGRRWFELVCKYSTTYLSFEADRLLAIQGVVDKIKRHFSEDYHFGLWQPTFIDGLCWRIGHDITGARREAEQRARSAGLSSNSICTAPSWSWASCPRPVDFGSTKGTEPLVEIISIGKGPSSSLRMKGVMEIHPFEEKETSNNIHWTEITNGPDCEPRYERPGASQHIIFDAYGTKFQPVAWKKLSLLYVRGQYKQSITCIVLELVDEIAKKYRRVGLSSMILTDPSVVFPNGKESEVLEIEII